MSFDFRFRFAEDEKDVAGLVNFLEKQPFNYPEYMDWVYRAREELLSGYKKVILAFNEKGLVADLIFQAHKDFPKHIIELKNMRIHPGLRNRYFGAFMIRQAEVEARKANYGALVCDTRSDRLDVIKMLEFCGWSELGRTSLYEENVEDLIMIKGFEKNDKGIFRPLEKKIFNKSA